MRFVERVLNRLRDLDRHPVKVFDLELETEWLDTRAELVGQLAGWLDDQGYAQDCTFEDLIDMCIRVSYADVYTLKDVIDALF